MKTCHGRQNADRLERAGDGSDQALFLFIDASELSTPNIDTATNALFLFSNLPGHSVNIVR